MLANDLAALLPDFSTRHLGWLHVVPGKNAMKIIQYPERGG
jgi:hypothetical protein